jgi:hypothetical protein
MPGFDFDRLVQNSFKAQDDQLTNLFNDPPFDDLQCTDPIGDPDNLFKEVDMEVDTVVTSCNTLCCPNFNSSPLHFSLNSAPLLLTATSTPSLPTGGKPTPSKKNRAPSTQKYQKDRSKKRRKVREQQAKESAISNYHGYAIKSAIRKRHIFASTPAEVVFDLAGKRVTSTGYEGLRSMKLEKCHYALGEMVGENSKYKFRLVKWDGK